MFIIPVQKMINFSYIKNETLFFVFNHPAGKQEFDNSIQSIKSALNSHMPEECQDTSFKDIKAFVTHTPKKEPIQLELKRESYKERASGEVKVNIQDEKLNSLVRSIQKIIKEKNES